MKTLLKVMSIIYIILAAIVLLAGIALAVMGSSFAIAGGGSDYADILTALGVGGAIVLIIACIPTLLVGIFGLKGCGGNQGLLMAGIVLTIIGLALSVIGIIVTAVQGVLDATSIVSLVIPILYLIGAFGTKGQNAQ